MKLISRRAGTAVAFVALVASTLAVSAAPAQAHPVGDPEVNAGAMWLRAQLTDGIIHNEQYDFDDLGLSADVAVALYEAGDFAAAASVVAAIEPRSEAWVADPETPGRIYAGSLAKLVSTVQATGGNPSSYNSQDQVTRLEARIASTAPIEGRLEDAGVDPTVEWDSDFVNVIGQSNAARALSIAGSEKAPAVTDFLLEQQCAAGFFRFGLTADKTSADQGCDASGDTAHLDTTSLSLINLMAVPAPSAAVKESIADGIAWLETQQATDGSFSAGGTEGVNANSAGLAGWALGGAGESAAATKAAIWLRRLQVADIAPCATTLTAANGAIAFNADALDRARGAAAIAIPQRDQFRRATAQALPALAHLPAGNGVLGINAPLTAAERTTVHVTVSGLGAGEAGCVTFGGTAKTVAGTGSDLTLTFDLPAGAATHTFAVTTVDGATATSTLTATVPIELKPAPSTGELRAKKIVKVRKNTFRVPVVCKGASPCAGTIRVRTARKVKVNGKAKARKVLVAKKAYSIETGTTAKVVLKVRKPVRKSLVSKRLKVKAVASAPEAERSRATFWLKSR